MHSNETAMTATKWKAVLGPIQIALLKLKKIGANRLAWRKTKEGKLLQYTTDNLKQQQQQQQHQHQQQRQEEEEEQEEQEQEEEED